MLSRSIMLSTTIIVLFLVQFLYFNSKSTLLEEKYEQQNQINILLTKAVINLTDNQNRLLSIGKESEIAYYNIMIMKMRMAGDRQSIEEAKRLYKICYPNREEQQ